MSNDPRWQLTGKVMSFWTWFMCWFFGHKWHALPWSSATDAWVVRSRVCIYCGRSGAEESARKETVHL